LENLRYWLERVQKASFRTYTVRRILSDPIWQNFARMNDTKQKFLSAVQILAPKNQTILQLAGHVPEERLPLFPGAAALQFVASVHDLLLAACPDRARGRRRAVCPTSPKPIQRNSCQARLLRITDPRSAGRN
jgi:hypothetical protein